MEDLYDDLDNYNDVNALQELRTENQKLKNIISRYETTLEELKTDYDKLEAAYKTLEANYSSLMKTARGEIERKTSRITQLNQEKDTLVLESLKRGTKSKRNFKKGSGAGNNNKHPNVGNSKGKNAEGTNTGQQAKAELPSVKTDNKSPVDKVQLDDSKKNTAESKKAIAKENTKAENKDTPDKKAKNTQTGSKSDSKTCHDNVGSKKDTSKERKNNVGENIKTGDKDLLAQDKKSKDTPSSSKVDTKSRQLDKVSNVDSKRDSSKDRKNTHPRTDNKDISEKKSKDTFSSSKLDSKSPYPGQKEESSKTDLYQNRKPNVTETVKNDIPLKCAGSIRDRRKSTPAFISSEPKFSSDEETEQGYHPRHPRTGTPPMGSYGRRYLDRIPNDRESNRTSDTSSMEERAPHYYEPPRDTYRSRFDRHHPMSSIVVQPPQRMEQYDDRYRKRYGPDRDHRKRPFREYNQDEYHRPDPPRYRHLDSPPREIPHRHQHRIIETRDHYDRYLHDYDQYRHGDTHRQSFGYDEPHSKRQKFDSHNKNVETYPIDESKLYPDREPVSKKSNPKFSPHELDIPDGSCQSPDFEHSETSAHSVKEIMSTAATPLADPRVTSTHYALINNNGLETLTTTVGRNVDIIPVDKSKWGSVVNVDVPDALKRRPSQENMIKDLYTDLTPDDPAVDVALEPGEIYDEDNFERPYNDSKTQNIVKDVEILQPSENVSKTKNKPEKFLKTHTPKLRAPKDVEILEPSEKVSKPKHKSEDVPRTHTSKLRTPKASQPKSHLDISNTDANERTSVTNIEAKDIDDSISIISLPKLDESAKHDNNLSSKTENKDKSRSDSQTTLAKMAIVADDLELSDDENIDNIDINTEIAIRSKHSSKVLSKIKATIEKDSKLIKETESSNNAPVSKVQISISSEEKIQDFDSTKKLKSKRRKSKSKEVSKELIENKDIAQTSAEDATARPKTDEPKPVEIKQKFSDLFGDSNSLMTPEDLGIPTYLPLSEDAQNAVDLEIKKRIEDPGLVDDDESLVHKSNSESKKDSEKKHETVTANVLQPLPVENKEVTKDIKKKRASKRKDRVESNKISLTNIADVNLHSETNIDETDVVATVVISKGVQPSVLPDNNVEIPVDKPAVNVLQPKKDCDKNLPAMDFKKLELKALATSTPCKDLSAINSTHADSRFTNIVTNPNNRIVNENKNLVQLAEQSDSSTVDTLDDAPDVRIFVKRRRKTLKRPPMT